MPSLLLGADPDGLLEYSVVYSDRSLNHGLNFMVIRNGLFSYRWTQLFEAANITAAGQRRPLNRCPGTWIITG